MQQVVDIKALEEMLKATGQHQAKPFRPSNFELEFLVGSQRVLRYKHMSRDLVVAPEVLSDDKKRTKNLLSNIQNAYDFSGASVLETTFSQTNETRSTTHHQWKDWFLKKITPSTLLVPDTNFLMRHYTLNVLSPLLGEDFQTLSFRIPNLVLMEIERRGNQGTQTEKRLAFYAAQEVISLRKGNAQLLNPVDVALLTGFTEKAGKQLVDVWIRREIHDFVASYSLAPSHRIEKGDILFLTCDLMNALAAEAEGLFTCYFSKQKSEEMQLDSLTKVARFILTSSIIFEKISIDLYLEDVLTTKAIFEGIWPGKTPHDWINDHIRLTVTPISQKKGN